VRVEEGCVRVEKRCVRAEKGCDMGVERKGKKRLMTKVLRRRCTTVKEGRRCR
jgi:hypothetical protein